MLRESGNILLDLIRARQTVATLERTSNEGS